MPKEPTDREKAEAQREALEKEQAGYHLDGRHSSKVERQLRSTNDDLRRMPKR